MIKNAASTTLTPISFGSQPPNRHYFFPSIPNAIDSKITNFHTPHTQPHMSKVRTSGKSRKTKPSQSSSMHNEESTEIVQALAQTLSMFDGSAMADSPAAVPTSSTKKQKQTSSTPTTTTTTPAVAAAAAAAASSMGDEETATTTNTSKKNKSKDTVPEVIVSAPAASEITALLPQRSKIDRTVVGLNKEGSEMTKTRSKKDRLKMKQQALVDHIAAKNEAVELHTKTTKKNNNIFNFSDDFTRALDEAAENGVDKIKANPLTSILTGAPQFKKDKKSTKALENDRAKFQDVIQHPAFQSNSIGALQQHLTNQMAMMRQIDEQQNGPKKDVEKTINKTKQGSEQKYNKLIKNDRTLASSMRK